MNTAALDKLIMWLFAFQLAFVLGLAGNFILSAIAAVHCAHKGPREGRTAWTLCIIFFPLVGWISYWLISQKEESHADLGLYKTPPPAPPPKTTRDIADQITAELGEKKRSNWINQR